MTNRLNSDSRSSINPSLQKERERVSFEVCRLTEFLDGGAARTKLRRQMIQHAEKCELFQTFPIHFQNHKERYLRGLKIRTELLRLKKKLNLDEEGFMLLKFYISQGIGTDMHELAFLPYLKTQSDDEQYQKWVPLAENWEIIGAYAQTELGHGSNVRGIETIAEFIEETDEFELNSPTLSSTKWWVGGMGKTATHAIVMAQLKIKGKNYGVHPFFVQLRCLETHQLMKGVVCGDIGPKLGLNASDNGFAHFTRVRIPRSNMLMRYFKVDRNGNYTKPENEKIVYSGMTGIRSGMTYTAFTFLAKAATIAIRYSAVRRQFAEDDTKEERQILDYQMQQYRIFPTLATAYAFFFVGQYSHYLFQQMQKEIKQGNMSSLAEVHATSSGLKSLSTRLAAELIEECRLACGGHGYSNFSGFPHIYGELCALTSAEGETYVLTQQTTRYLLKVLQASLQGKPLARGVQYLKNIDSLMQKRCPQDLKNLRDPEFQLTAFAQRTAWLLVHLGQSLQNAAPSGKSPAEIWNLHLVNINRTSNAHCMYIFVEGFVKMVEQLKQTHPDLYPPLKRLSDFFALWSMEKNLADFLESGFLAPHHATLIHQEVCTLMAEIRPDAVGLVDAFDLADNQLNSALGRYDGKAYETLFEWAQKDPLNAEEIVEGYKEYIRPLIKEKLFSKL